MGDSYLESSANGTHWKEGLGMRLSVDRRLMSAL
jgi:hypothetical protein